MNKSTYTNYGVLNLDPNFLNEDQIKKILSANWFEPTEKFNRGIILIDLNQLSQEIQDFFYDDENKPSDFGINRPEDNIRIDNCLKRWNKIDGFYHA